MLPKIAISSISCGRTEGGHSLPRKVKAAAAAGFDGFELAIQCLELHAKAIAPTAPRVEALKAAAEDCKRVADEEKIELMCLQPFMGYDALKEPEERFKEALVWIDLCEIMGVKIFQIPTTTYPNSPDILDVSLEHIASNIQRVADAAASRGIDIAYEAPAWGIAVDTWQEIDKIIKLANRPNIRHCLDTFHIAAVVAGDVNSPETGYLQPNAAEKLAKDLEELKTTIKPAEISYFQLSDVNAVDMSQAKYPVVDHDQPPNMTWSRNCRIFPCEKEGVLPAVEVAKAVFATGYRGWVSMEVFHADHYDTRETVPEEWAKRGMDSWRKVVKECGLEKE